MDLQKLLRVGICVAGIGVSISACTPNATETTTSDSAARTQVAVEQAVWEKLTNDGDAAKAKGDLKKAEECYQAAVQEAQKLGENDPSLAKTTANLADFYYAQGDGAQADKLYKQSLTIREKALGLEHADLVQSILGLARVSSAEKNYAESVAHYERAIAILNKNSMPVSDEVQAEYKKAKDNASGTKGSTKTEAESTEEGGAKKSEGGAKKGDAESKKGDAESKKGDAESKKGDAESKKGDAESKKGDAESKKGDSESKKDDSAKKEQ
ncbi:MAG: tetratricopeptide repeat protein [Candidatus Obscuribacterales bacterium]